MPFAAGGWLPGSPRVSRRGHDIAPRSAPLAGGAAKVAEVMTRPGSPGRRRELRSLGSVLDGDSLVLRIRKGVGTPGSDRCVSSDHRTLNAGHSGEALGSARDNDSIRPEISRGFPEFCIHRYVGGKSPTQNGNNPDLFKRAVWGSKQYFDLLGRNRRKSLGTRRQFIAPFCRTCCQKQGCQKSGEDSPHYCRKTGISDSAKPLQFCGGNHRFWMFLQICIFIQIRTTRLPFARPYALILAPLAKCPASWTLPGT
jgi:hypothetical protein